VTALEARARYLRTGHFDALDGFRALGILAVVGHHIAGGRGVPILDRGLGVTVFFSISGFVITALLLRERRRTGSISLTHFYLRRSLRIFPLYYAVLALYVLLVAWAERDAPAGARFFEQLPFFLTFTSNWFIRPAGQHDIFYFAWSLATQEQFYLLWPLVIRYARTWWVPPVVMALLLLGGEGARWAIGTGHLATPDLGARILANISTPICLGSIAACVLEREWGFDAALHLAGRPWSAPLWVAALALPSVLDFGAVQLAFTSAVVALLLITCVVRPDNLVRPVLVNQAARYVGRVSYGVYLLHMLALNLSRRLLPGRGAVALFTATTAVSLVAAGASFAFFERPILEGGKRRLLASRGPSGSPSRTPQDPAVAAPRAIEEREALATAARPH